MSETTHSSAAAMAAEICEQIRSVFSPSPLTPISGEVFPPPLSVLVAEISSARRIFVHGVGREGLMMKALCMRLFHLGLDAHAAGDVTAPPIAAGDLLIASAGPGGFATVDALCRVAKSCGARVALVTANPRSGIADAVAFLPATMMADGEEWGGGVKMMMGGLYEGAMFVLFEMVVISLAERMGRTPREMRARHTNLE